MNRFYLFFLSLLFGLFLYTLPAYSGGNFCGTICADTELNPVCCPSGGPSCVSNFNTDIVLCLNETDAGNIVPGEGACCLPDQSIEGLQCTCNGQTPTPLTVAVIKCCMEKNNIPLASISANGTLPGECNVTTSHCAGCIQALQNEGLELRQTNVEGMCSWYHFFDDRDRDGRKDYNSEPSPE